jgi:hypothetical protein
MAAALTPSPKTFQDDQPEAGVRPTPLSSARHATAARAAAERSRARMWRDAFLLCLKNGSIHQGWIFLSLFHKIL